jgi:hypothetical protein
MPASNLTPEQRRAEQRRREQAQQQRNAANKPKPGSKGHRTNNTSSNYRSSTTPPASRTSSPTTRTSSPSTSTSSLSHPKEGDVTVKEGNKFIFRGGVWRKLSDVAPPAPTLPSREQLDRPPAPPRSPAIGAPVHASPQAFGSSTQVQGGVLSAQPSVYAPQAGAESRPNTPQPSSDSAYGADGKQLYMAHKGNNPLMQRTFGYQTGQHPGAQPQQPSAPTQPTAPAQAAPTQPMAPQYEGNDEPGRLGQAENPLAALAEILNRKKLTISASN